MEAASTTNGMGVAGRIDIERGAAAGFGEAVGHGVDNAEARVGNEARGTMIEGGVDLAKYRKRVGAIVGLQRFI